MTITTPGDDPLPARASTRPWTRSWPPCGTPAPGETYIPRVPSARMTDIAAALIGDRQDRDRRHRHPARREDPRDPGLARRRPTEPSAAGRLLRDPAHAAGAAPAKSVDSPASSSEYSSADDLMAPGPAVRSCSSASDLPDPDRRCRRTESPAMKIMTVLGTRRRSSG